MHELDRVLLAFGYQSLKGFKLDCNLNVNGQESVSEPMDWGVLSMFICDTHEDGILMEKKEAIKETKKNYRNRYLPLVISKVPGGRIKKKLPLADSFSL